MPKPRTPHSPSFKAKVALEALKEDKTLGELSQAYKLQSTQISAWKNLLKEGAASVFDKQSLIKERVEQSEREQELYARIGQLQMELEWVKKKLGLPNSR
jgi:transposase-like protein